MEWLKNAKRKPTPSDFLDLANEADNTPDQILRLQRIVAIPVLEAIANPVPKDDKVLGCPIALGRMLKLAESKNIPFGEHQQLEYLRSGVLPDWVTEQELRPVTATDIKGMPSRDELLAMLTPEQRVIALGK